ncbi:MAG: hypothetical protein WB587_06015 [Nitrososphaeraceae archaeon]
MGEKIGSIQGTEIGIKKTCSGTAHYLTAIKRINLGLQIFAADSTNSKK